MARRIVSKLVVSNAMSDAPELADRMISHPVSGGRSLRQIILRKVLSPSARQPNWRSLHCGLSRNGHPVLCIDAAEASSCDRTSCHSLQDLCWRPLQGECKFSLYMLRICGPLHESTESQEARRSDEVLLVLQHTYKTLKSVDEEMERLLNETYASVSAMLQRNRACYDELMRALMEAKDQTLDGEEVRAIVDQHACKEDLDRRNLERAVFL